MALTALLSSACASQHCTSLFRAPTCMHTRSRKPWQLSQSSDIPPAALRRRRDEAAHGCQAVKKSDGAVALDEWSSLAGDDSGDYDPEDDPDFQTSINEVANKALKAMLNDDSKAIAQFKEELDVLGEYLANEGNKQALTFCYTLLKMCDHVLCKESLKLQGVYLKAFEKLYSILEESGWKLKQEGDESSDDEESFELPSLGSYS